MTVQISALIGGVLLVTGVAEALAVAPPHAVAPSDDVSASSGPAANAGAPPASVIAQRVERGNPLWAIPLRLLRATRERPLFAPTRRPPPPAVTNAYQAPAVTAPAPPKVEKPQLTLVGTIAGEAEAIAVFIDKAAKTVVRLKIGEAHDGWILRAVNRRDVVLEKGRESLVLALPPVETSSAAKGVPPSLGAPSLGTPQAPARSFQPHDTPNGGGVPVLRPGEGLSGSSPAREVFPLPPGVRPPTEPTTFSPFKTPVRAR